MNMEPPEQIIDNGIMSNHGAKEKAYMCIILSRTTSQGRLLVTVAWRHVESLREDIKSSGKPPIFS